MEKFKNFELENQEMIFGGILYVTTCGREVCDLYDSEKERIIYLS